MILLGLELGSPVILTRLSRIERREESESQAARTLRPFTPDGRRTVLLVGNSARRCSARQFAGQSGPSVGRQPARHRTDALPGLVLRPVSPSRRGVSSECDRTYSGDRPACVQVYLGRVFCASTDERARLPVDVRQAKPDKTTASTYLFAHWSNWLADKGFIRQDVLILLVPNFRALAARIADHGPHVDNPSVLLGMAKQRLPELHDLAQTYGVKIVLLVPPTLRQDHSQEVQELGDKVGVPVWVLSLPGEFPPDLFFRRLPPERSRIGSLHSGTR